MLMRKKRKEKQKRKDFVSNLKTNNFYVLILKQIEHIVKKIIKIYYL